MNVDPQKLRQTAIALSIPAPPAETIGEILKTEGMMLVRQLEEASKNNQRAQEYIRGVFLACHPSTTERLLGGRIQSAPSIETLVAIGKAEGSAFAQRVKEWEAAGFVNGDDARYIRLTLARYLEQEASRRAQREQQDAQAAQGNSSQAPVTVANALHYRPGRGVPGQQQPPRVQNAPAPEPAPAPATEADDHAHLQATDDRHDDYGQRASRQPEPDYDRQPQRAQQASQRLATQSEPQHRSRPPQQVGEGRQAATVDGDAAGEQTYLSQHIYGGRAAACFSADQTRGKVHTVRLEAAESSAQRQYDWQGKIAIQLSQRELPLVLAVFMGWLHRFEGKGHGENNSKWFTIENQGNKLFLSVNAKGRSPRGIPIMPGDGYPVTTLLMRQMLKNDPFLSPEILLSLVRKEAALAGGQAHPTQQRAAA